MCDAIISTAGTECRWLAFDFLASVTDSKAETEFFTVTLPKTLDELKDDIALLVNNVGVGNEAPFLAPDVEVEEEASMVRVNCGAAVRMCRVLLPRMAARRAGAVLNISSGSCAQPTPYLAVYSATKAFLVQYSRSIAREYEDKGLLVTCVTPYYISGTGLYANTKASQVERWQSCRVAHSILKICKDLVSSPLRSNRRSNNRPLRQHQGLAQRAARQGHRERRARDGRVGVVGRARARLFLPRARPHGIHLRHRAGGPHFRAAARRRRARGGPQRLDARHHAQQPLALRSQAREGGRRGQGQVKRPRTSPAHAPPASRSRYEASLAREAATAATTDKAAK